MTTRTITTRRKVETPHGSLYVHLDWIGQTPVGFGLSSPGKDPDSAIERMFRALNPAMDERVRWGLRPDFHGFAREFLPSAKDDDPGLKQTLSNLADITAKLWREGA